jgi:hypothetical protein
VPQARDAGAPAGAGGAGDRARQDVAGGLDYARLWDELGSAAAAAVRGAPAGDPRPGGADVHGRCCGRAAPRAASAGASRSSPDDDGGPGVRVHGQGVARAVGDRLAAERFDYVVVDEVHHAAAESYRRILARLEPRLPARADRDARPRRRGRASSGCSTIMWRIAPDLGRGVQIGRLVPFRYFGVRDDIDYRNLPWRNRRFDAGQLAAAVQSERRMRRLWAAWRAHPGTRTLVFCCSVAHADYAAGWLAARGVRVARVYSAPGSDDRDLALRAAAPRSRSTRSVRSTCLMKGSTCRPSIAW